ncbi:hypothetical protein CGERO_01295 [Corynebacterium gerontici]|uniref:Uncharacterized protein n=1 Tax=Corynebacterium gerontici TaxID=2079234 RepID=A0A3G6IYN0_9CORY|nr:hypothetical protein CGERO_01295 [Corynebacterium gerontici]
MARAGKRDAGILSINSLADHSAMRAAVRSLPELSKRNDWIAKATGMRPSPKVEA